jgi:hypothetical protein
MMNLVQSLRIFIGQRQMSSKIKASVIFSCSVGTKARYKIQTLQKMSKPQTLNKIEICINEF